MQIRPTMKTLILFISLFIGINSFAQSWQDVGGGTNNSSHGMLTWNGKLINLGSFNNPCNRVAEWDGASWNCLGGGVGIVARAGVVWDGKLVVVGDFWNVQQPCVGCNGVAVWDGVSWTPLGNGVNNDVLTCTVWNNELVIGGDFTQSDGAPIARIAKWNGTAWESVGPIGSFGNDIRCMTEFEGELWVGGDFNNVGGNSPSDGVVKYDPSTGGWAGGNSGVDLVGGVNESVRVLYVNPNDGNLYMGGEFPELWDGDAAAEDYNMGGVAMYDGSNWTPLGTGLNEYCRAIHEYNGDIIAGGYFTNAGGTPANKIAKWDGTSWSAMGLGFDASGIDEYVKSATTWNGIFFAGGAYTQAEGNPMNYIAQWYEPATSAPVAWMTPSSTTLCGSGCIDFVDNSTNGPTSWNWTFPGSSTPTSTDQDPLNICWPSPGTYTVSLQACNAIGCTTQDLDIEVTNGATVSVNDASICGGGPETLTAVPSAAGGTFLWSPSGETTASIDVNPGSSTTYTVTYSYLGCTSSATSTVTVGVGPSVAVSSTGNICEGQSTTLTATPAVGGGTYLWSPGGDITASINVTPSSTTTYSVVYTLNGCDSPLESETITVNPAYNLSENVNACENTAFTYPDGFSETITSNTSHTSNLLTVAGCDSIIVTNVTANQAYSFSENVNACNGDTYVYPDGFSETITGNTAHTSNLTTGVGCDSTIVTNVTVFAAYNNSENVSVCSGSNYTYPDGFSETITANTSHSSNLTTTNNCDSIIVTNVTMVTAFNTSENISACENTSVVYPDGFTETITGNTSHTSNLLSTQGCDSIVVTNVTMDANYSITESATACDGTTFIYPDGFSETITANTSHTSNLTSVAGCDSVIVTTVTMNVAYNSSEGVMACSGATITYPDGFSETITGNTSHTSNLTAVTGCDSIVVTNVTLAPSYNLTQSVEVCVGADYTYPDGTLSSNITADESNSSTLLTINGCDSTIVTNLTVVSAIDVTENLNICSGEDYTYPDGTISTNITVDETHISNLTASAGCDSNVTTNLTVDPIPNATVTESGNVLTAQQAGATYQWVDCDNGNAPISGETNQTFAPTVNGNYAVIIDLGGCIETSTCTLISTIGLDELNTSGLTVYPNPTMGSIKIQSKEELLGTNYAIHDASGRILLQGSLDSKQVISVESLSSGTYILRLDQGEKGQIRIVKE